VDGVRTAARYEKSAGNAAVIDAHAAEADGDYQVGETQLIHSKYWRYTAWFLGRKSLLSSLPH